MPPTRSEERIETLLGRFDLTDEADARISTFSKGMKQKTGLIQALLGDPDVLFLDEPTSGLDTRAARTVRETIAGLTAGDTTVFLSTHVLPVVEELADTVGVLYEGALLLACLPGAVVQSDFVARSLAGSVGTSGAFIALLGPVATAVLVAVGAGLDYRRAVRGFEGYTL